MKTKHFPRQLKSRIDIAMQDTPVILINGPRQSGKTTLAREYSLDLTYYTLDDKNWVSGIYPINLKKLSFVQSLRPATCSRGLRLSQDLLDTAHKARYVGELCISKDYGYSLI